MHRATFGIPVYCVEPRLNIIMKVWIQRVRTVVERCFFAVLQHFPRYPCMPPDSSAGFVCNPELSLPLPYYSASRGYPFMNLVSIPDMRASRTCFEKHVPVMVFPMPDPDDAPEPGNPVDAPEPNPDDAPEPGNPDDAPEPNPDDAPEPGSPDDVPEPDPDNAPEPLWPWKDCRGRYARNVRGFPKRLAG